MLWPLRNCAALVGEDMQPLAFVPESVGIVLDLVADRAKDPPWLTGRLLLVRDGETLAQADQFRFINETHVLAGRQIYETPPVGENFGRLALFASSFPEPMLERCLSLLFSHFTGVAARYNGYATTVGEPLHARTSILFQNVDESGDLHFDLIQTLPRFPVDFTRKYDITRVAVVNEAEKTIVVREVVYPSLADERLGLTRVLNRHQKELGENAEAMLYADEHGFIVGKDLAGLFLGRELSDLARRYVLLGAEKLQAYRIKPVTPRLKLKLGFGIDFLDGAADLEIDGQSFSLMDVLAQHRKNSYVTLSDGTHAVMNTMVMPRSLLFNWQREVERFCPALKCCVYHGANRDLDAAMRGHLVLTTYGTLRGSIEQFMERQFYYVIRDESQAIKNSDTQTSKAVLLLKAQRRLALSGTPIENHLGELFSLFRFLNPAMFGSEGEFNRNYAVPIHQHDDKEAARELRRKIYPFILRRLKRDVLKELPEKIEQTLYVDMSVEQKRLYDSRRRFYYETIKRRIAEDGMHASRFFILEALLELRQVATIPEEKSEGAIVPGQAENAPARASGDSTEGNKGNEEEAGRGTAEYAEHAEVLRIRADGPAVRPYRCQ